MGNENSAIKVYDIDEKAMQVLKPGMTLDDEAPGVLEAVNPLTIGRAYETYLNTDLTLQELALDTGIPYNKLVGIAVKNKWATKKQAIQDEIFRMAENRYQNFVADNKLPTAQRHVEVAKEIEAKVLEVAKNINSSDSKADMKLVRVAKALSDASNVSARAVGLGLPGSETPGYSGTGKPGSKQPLVIIGLKAEKLEVSQSS